MARIRQVSFFLFNGIFALIIWLFVLDAFRVLEIKNQMLKSGVYLGILIISPIALVIYLLHFRTNVWGLSRLAFSILICIGLLIIGPSKVIFSSSAWETYEVLYEDTESNRKKVEYQMQDIGALGYNKRTVEVIYLTNLFMITSPYETQ